MVRVGIVGMGMMGTIHFKCYKAVENAKVVAICEIDQNKLKYNHEFKLSSVD